MPTSLNFNGRITARPGVYTRIVNDLVSGLPAPTGNLAVIGDFPSLPSRLPVSFASSAEFEGFVNGLDRDLVSIADIAFKPFGSAGASISSLTLVNYGTSTAASISSSASHTFTSRLSGLIGNRLALSIVAQADGRNTIKVFQGGVRDPQNRVSMYRNVGLATGDSLAAIRATMIGVPVTYSAMKLELDGTNLKVSGVPVAGGADVVLATFVVADEPSLNDVLDRIAALDLSDVASWAISYAAADVTLNRLDMFSSTNVTSANFLFTDNAARLVDVLSNDSFIFAERKASGSVGIEAIATTRFAGGLDNSQLTNANFELALDELKDTAVNTLVVMSTNVALQALALQHCKDAAAEFGMNRNMWSGSSAEGLDTAFASHAAALNSELASIAFQSFTFANGVTRDSSFMALLLAAMQNATPAATPLTKRRLRADITSVSPMLSSDEIEESLGKGVVAITMFRPFGLAVERGLTTWMLDDNPIKSEVSSMESVNQSVRQLRQAVLTKIGARITSGMANDLKAAAVKELSQQKADGLIFNFANVEVVLSGDTAAINYDVAAAEPLNFITITANIVR